MNITIGGIITILFILALFFKNISSLKKMFFSFFSASIITNIIFDLGYFMKLGSTEIAYNYIFSIILFPISILIISKYYKKSNIPFLILLFMGSILISFTISIITKRSIVSVPYNSLWDNYFDTTKTLPSLRNDISQFIKMIIRIILFFLNLWAFSCIIEPKLIKKLISITTTCSLILIIYYFFELAFNNFVSYTSLRSFVQFVFGKSSSSYDSPRQFLNIYPPLLFNNEPSSTSFTMFILAINCIASSKLIKKTHLIYTFIYLFGLLFSGSFSSLIYFFLIITILIFTSKHSIRWIITALIFGVPFLITIMNVYSNRIQNIFYYISLFNNSQPAVLPKLSEIIRLYSIYNNLKIFFSYPLFGVGLGVCYSFSGFITTLCNIGLIGTFLWSKIVSSSCKNLKFHKSSIIFGFFIFFMSFLFTGHMGIMVYLEKSLYLFIITTLTCKKEVKNFLFNEFKNEILLRHISNNKVPSEMIYPF